MRNFKLIAITALTVTSFAAAVPAYALTNSSTNTVQATISKADLTTKAGAQEVYAELSEIAADSCSIYESTTLFSKRIVAKCTSSLLSDFVESADSDQLDAVHRAAITRR